MTKRPHANLELIKRVLGDGYLELAIQKLELHEDVDCESSRVEVIATDGKRQIEFAGTGCGLIDALWSAALDRFAAEYESLKSVKLANFTVGSRLDTKKHQEGTDAIGEVTLEATNSDGVHFAFSDASRSVASSSARAVLAAMEYFVNAERAFIALFRSRQDAKERNRSDLVTRYTRELAEVVKSTSYAELIEKMKKELG